MALAGCAAGSREAVTVTVTTTVTSEAAPSTPRAKEEPRNLADVARVVTRPLPRSRSGHLAYVGTDGNVYVVHPRTALTVQVTDDASSAQTDLGIFHTGLAWSRTGELAFARTNVESFTSSVFVTVPGTGSVTRVAGPSGMLIYASWSPATCRALACSRLATIADVNGEPGGNVALKVLQFAAGARPRHVVDEKAAQIYFAWAGGPTRLVRHVLGPGLGSAGRLDHLDLASGASTRVGGRLAPFFAPAFARGRVVFALADGPKAREGDATVTLDRSTVVVHAPRNATRVAFAPSPDGTQLAFAVRLGPRSTPPLAFDQAHVVDLRTGKVTPVGSPTLWTKAFYWSPDSTRLAYLTWLDNEYRQYNQWRVFDVVAETDAGFAAFEPTRTFDTVTTFFDQFGQSHNLWSPDGRYLTYGAVSIEGRQQVWLVDTKRNGESSLVADGVVSAFSWR